MMAGCASFHRNVHLLNQVVPPSDDFRKFFGERMFDKPNTAGFIHVSHYLLTIYDAERFKMRIQWPVTCKKTEAKYRNDVREYLTVVASENPDIDFPTIVGSNLFQAKGTKFIIIMSKLSQVTLRAYIKREATIGDIMLVPKVCAVSGLTKQFLYEAKAKINFKTTMHHNVLSRMEEVTLAALERGSNDLEKIKTSIFEKEKILASIASDAPVHISIKKRLVDINDADVIQMWRASINEGLNHISKSNEAMREIDKLSSKVQDVLKKSTGMKILNGKEFHRVLIAATPKSFVHPEIECLFYQLYKDEQLALNIFFRLLHLLLNRLHRCFKANGLEDPSNYLSAVWQSQKHVNSILGQLQSCLIHVRNLSLEVQTLFSQTKTEHSCYGITSPVADNVLLMPSPHIKIDTNESLNAGSDLQKRLELTPVEGAHKSLFSRYLRQNPNQNPNPNENLNHNTSLGTRLKGKFLISRKNLADSFLLNSSEKQFPRPRTNTPKRCQPSAKRVDKYSRLFSTQTVKNTKTANGSFISLASFAKANSTAITNPIAEVEDISELNLDITPKSFCDVSGQFSTPGHSSYKHQNKLPRTPEADYERSHPPVQQAMQAEVTSNSSSAVKVEQRKPRRRSIGDLVERYKNLLEARNRIPSPQVDSIQQEND